jgi:cytochrome oxidase Cu insertion factor (SCO1/SenC/PrrC family)
MKRLVLAAALAGAALMPGATVPRPAPPLSFVASNGAKVDLASLKGKVVAVEILSTTCPACQKASQILANMKREFGAKGFEAIGYAIDPNANVQEFTRLYAPNFPVGKGDRETAYGFLQISVMQQFYFPQLVFVDKTGTIRGQYGGTDAFVQTNEEANIRGMIQKLLAEGTATPAKSKAAPAKSGTKKGVS